MESRGRFTTAYDIHVPVGMQVRSQLEESEIGSKLDWIRDNEYAFIHIRIRHRSREEGPGIRDTLEQITGYDVIQWETRETGKPEKYYDGRDHE